MLMMATLMLQATGVVRPSITGMVLQASTVQKITLLILLLLSVVSWAIILYKYRALRRVEREARLFADAVRMTTAVRDLPSATAALRRSIAARVVARGLAEVLPSRSGAHTLFPTEVRVDAVTPRALEAAENAMRRAISEEVSAMEQRLPFLATTGTVSPFIGLFGTVWGVMSAFLSMGIRGTAHLAVVGPGIAEALIATAAGLAAAIPAVIGYNYFINQVKRIADILDRTASEVRDRIAREPSAEA